MAGSPGRRDPETRRLLERAAAAVPHERQLAWQKLELTAFVHFGVNTFTDAEWGTGREDPAIFNPSALDARQWVGAFRAAGMRQVILTAKHHDGFCLWPSRFTGHSVKRSPWRGGRGDVVAELAEACREAGMKLGIYLSPADLNAIERGVFGNTPRRPRVVPAPVPGWTPKSGHRVAGEWDDYNAYYMNQLFELLTEYGPISEVWLDGANPRPETGQRYAFGDWYALVRALQPDAVIFGMGPDVRWCGNEAGRGREGEWSVLPFPAPPEQAIVEGRGPDPTAQDLGSLERLEGAPFLHWYPSEVDVSIRPGWFWHEKEDDRVKSLDDLLRIYDASVGSNAVLLLNVPPDRRGLVHERDAGRLAEFGEAIRTMFRENLATGARVEASHRRGGTEHAPELAIDGDPETFWTTEDWREEADLVFRFPAARRLDTAVLQEHIRSGQRIESFAVEVGDGPGWTEVARGTTVGWKRIVRFPRRATDRVRIRIRASRVRPTLAEAGFFDSGRHEAPAALPPEAGKDAAR